MERYFGFKIILSSELRPEDEQILRNKAKQLVDVEGIDLNKYHVYLHQLVIKANDEHFGVDGGLTKRLSKLNIEFHVNEKQRESGEIRFMNHIIETGVPKDVKPTFMPQWISYEIPIVYFDNNSSFNNAIIVFINKSVHQKKRKIKVVVTVDPLKSFLPILKKDKSDVTTNLDLRFAREVQLSLPFSDKETSPRGDSIVSRDTYINLGNVGAFGSSAQAHDFTNNLSFIADMKKLKNIAAREEEDEIEQNINSFLDCVSKKSNIKALNHLKKFGNWALDKTEKLGMIASAELIKRTLSG